MAADALDLLRRLMAENGGTLPFERFMAAALADPEFGYYSCHIRDVGRRGDFATSPTLDTALGHAIAHWLETARRRHVPSGPWHIIEIGAGNGELATQVLKTLGWWNRRRLRFHIVDSSEPLRRLQRDRLRRFPVQWHDSMPAALHACDGRALLYSNELVDAFPCQILVWDAAEAAWNELHLTFENDRLTEIFRPFQNDGIPSTLDRLTSSGALPDGQRVERHPSYFRWLKDWRPHWTAGAMLTLDYGGSPETIYHRRPAGTLRAYAHHQTFTGGQVYHRFGRQDLTADVNFDDLQLWEASLGLRTVLRQSQTAFIAANSSQASPAQLHPANKAFQALAQIPK